MSDYKDVTITVGRCEANCYLIVKKNGEAVMIDPGDDATKIKNAVAENGAIIKLILITHGHFDHILAVEELRKEYNAPVAIHEKDADSFEAESIPNVKSKNDTRPFKAPDILIKDSGKMSLCGFDFEVIHTPGHTKGSVCFVFDEMMFTGDTLFKNSIGRTDFPGGSEDEMRASLKLLCGLKRDYVVFPGHYEKTLLSEEKSNNYFVRRFLATDL